MAKRVLILGGAGMLGHKLCQQFAERFDTWASLRGAAHVLTSRGILHEARICKNVDAMNVDTVIRALADVKPDVVVNCVGVIKQLRDAADPIVSLSINSLFPHRLATICRASGVRMVHISTDCVFSGRKGAYQETSISDAEDLYGRTKFLGEVDAPGCLTLRTSIIGREIQTTTGLIEWFLSNQGKKVRGFARAFYTGFTTVALSDIIADIIEKHPQLAGLYHVSSEPIAKYDLLGLVNEVCRLNVNIERDTDFFCDRSLDSSRFREATGFTPPSWREMINSMYRDSTPYQRWRSE